MPFQNTAHGKKPFTGSGQWFSRFKREDKDRQSRWRASALTRRLRFGFQSSREKSALSPARETATHRS